MKPIDVLIVFVTALVAGVALGHIQEGRWSETRAAALIKQIELQDCSDVNPWKGPK